MNKFQKTYNLISNSKYKGVTGVYELDSKIKGPTVGVLMMTHGNEPCGLSVFEEYFNKKYKLEKGKILFILQNQKAAEGFLLRKPSESSNRFVDFNMNRVTELPSKKSSLYESRRIAELKPIYNSCNFLLDFHSTSQKSSPMVLTFGENSTQLASVIKGVPIIRDIHKLQKGKPVITLASSSIGKVAFECGKNNTDIAGKNAVNFNNIILNRIGMVKNLKGKFNKEKKPKIFEVERGVILKDNFNLIKRFKNFEYLKKGTVLARSDRKNKIVTDKNYYSVFCFKDYKNIPKGEEALFLLKKI